MCLMIKSLLKWFWSKEKTVVVVQLKIELNLTISKIKVVEFVSERRKLPFRMKKIIGMRD
jgi:hypothetical protein